MYMKERNGDLSLLFKLFNIAFKSAKYTAYIFSLKKNYNSVTIFWEYGPRSLTETFGS